MAALSANVVDSATGSIAPYGLLSPAVKVIEDNDPHWVNGFHYETLGCAGTTRLYSVCASASADVAESSGDQSRTYKPFIVQTVFECSSMSRTPAELEDLARAELEIVVQKAIEDEFMNGTLAELEATASSSNANRYLSDGDATALAGAAVKPRLGLALLEGALGSVGNGAQGLIHLPRSAVEALTLEGNDGVLRTKLDTPVVAGVGYTSDATATDVTLYGTGPVTVRLGPVVVTPDEVSQSVNRLNNTVTYRAERAVAITWDSCVHFSVPVDLTLDY